MARKALPTKIKEQKGRSPGRDSGGRPLNQNEPKPFPAQMKVPAFLDRYGKEEYKRIVPELQRLGLYTILDQTALHAYCQAYSVWRKALIQVNKGHIIQEAESGYTQPTGWLSVMNKQSEIMRKYMSEFGLTPSTRSSLSTSPLPDVDEDDVFGYRVE